MSNNGVAAPSRRWVFVIPVAAVMYMLAYIDRTNVSLILPYVGQDLPLSASAKGLASGIFFVGYMLLQIPAAILAARWSSRKTVLWLMITWSLAAMACGLVRSELELHIARFVLGVFEGGVWPAVLILLASWFPQRERARANALWMACLPVSAILMSPLSGWMLEHMSWRWVFVVQGLPPLIWAVVWWFAVADRPAQARWISAAERDHVESMLAQEEAAKPKGRQQSYGEALRNPTVLLLIVVYFFWMTGFYGFSLWLPSVVKTMTGDGGAALVGWLTAIPYVVALLSMTGVALWSDRTGNRRLAVAVPLVVATAAMLLGQWLQGPAWQQMLLLCVVAAGVYAPYGPFWAMPSTVLRFEVVAVALGLINALGNLGGFLGPYLVGWLTDATGSSATGFVVLAGFLAAAVVVTLVGVRPAALPEPEPETVAADLESARP
ncbi:sugar phosphate permease [Saccharopolyspora erythraea NRRL 2338]|uniref:Sugar transporter n=2 Tax=Saccharopolyspora erythraea TaxID=1836 RepID=A4FFB0_SACEN|nr:MFS transporter [Saccharopolyspora erythraea]EQD82192.1 MFS transporter [Saccharopolyspora erythraea D]PFG96458.1 sugar phosphate permease [Saccharopolyspora erythraea NRRL 2338]QRK92953.1 MFS transporter [Saccharopolyspora erythraea]CAM02735.1 putative sugar transporter [Saccharopolyspora erythraea NRRL 2338]